MVVGKLGGVDVYVVVSMDALDDFPLDLEFGLLLWGQVQIIAIWGGDKKNCFIQILFGLWKKDGVTCRTYLHVLVEQHDKDEAEDACRWYRAN